MRPINSLVFRTQWAKAVGSRASSDAVFGKFGRPAISCSDFICLDYAGAQKDYEGHFFRVFYLCDRGNLLRLWRLVLKEDCKNAFFETRRAHRHDRR